MHDEQQEQVPVGMEGTQESLPQNEETIPASNHRTLWIVGGILLLLGVFGVLAFNTFPKSTAPIEPLANVTEKGIENVATRDSSGDLCEAYENDIAVYTDARNNADIHLCACIDNEEMNTKCLADTGDSLKLNAAVNQMDVTLCENIHAASIQTRCVELVTSGIAYMEENDPQQIADLRMYAHADGVIEDYEQLLDDDPNDLPNLLHLTLAYAEKGLREQEQGRDQTPYVEKALATIEKAKEINSTESEVFRVEAYVYEIQPNLYKAIEIYDKAIEINPENALAYAGKGHAQRMLGLLNEAIENFNKAAALDVANTATNIYANICSLEFSRGNYEVAVENCLIVVENENNDNVFRSSALRILADIEIANRNFDVAKRYLTEALALDPQNPNLYIIWSRLNLYQDEYEEAEDNARKALELSPTRAHAKLALSHALYMQKNTTNLSQLLKKVLIW